MTAWTRRAKVAEPPRAELPKPAPLEDARTPEDIRNGWSYEAWARYHESITAAEAAWLFRPKIPPRPTQGNKRSPHARLSFSPFDRWRR